MSRPRYVRRGAIVAVVRRCSERRFFLKPDPALTRVLKYLFALACKRFGLKPLSVCFMSNHYHAVFYDPEGLYPAFSQWFHCMVAKAVNALRGRRDHFWDVARTHVLHFDDGIAVLKHMTYVLGNPTAAGLVEDGREWPGFRSAPGACVAKAEVIERPDMAFFKDATWPDSVELKFHVPPTHASLTPNEFANLLSDHTRAYEHKLATEARADGHVFPGARGVMKRRWSSAATSPEEIGDLIPEVAATDRERRFAFIEMLRVFTAEHTAAHRAFRDGDHEVVFPHGTWLMAQQYNVNVAAMVHPPPWA